MTSDLGSPVMIETRDLLLRPVSLSTRLLASSNGPIPNHVVELLYGDSGLKHQVQQRVDDMLQRIDSRFSDWISCRNFLQHGLVDQRRANKIQIGRSMRSGTNFLTRHNNEHASLKT